MVGSGLCVAGGGLRFCGVVLFGVCVAGSGACVSMGPPLKFGVHEVSAEAIRVWGFVALGVHKVFVTARCV